jgi:hypothetical protein
MNVSFSSFKYVEIHPYSIIFVKPGLMADTVLILVLPYCRNVWLCSLSLLAFSPNCWSWTLDSQDLVCLWTPRLLMNTTKASSMTCTMHLMRYVNVGHSMPEASREVWTSQDIEEFEETLFIVIPKKCPSISSKQSRTSFHCLSSRAAVCWPLTWSPHWTFEIGKEWAFDLREWQLNVTQCAMSIHILRNDQW